MRTAILLMFLLSPAFAFLGNIVSFGLDNVPVIGNIKNLGEAITGRDMVTDEELSTGSRIFSLFCAIPGVNYLKKAKHLKNGQKFFKAAKRAKEASKWKNFFKFTKAGERAMKKANKFLDVSKKIFQFAKHHILVFDN